MTDAFIISQYWHSHVGTQAHHQTEDLLDPKDTSRGILDTYQIQWIWNSHVLTSNAHLVRCPWYTEKDPFDQIY
jgi:hypothetical protein